MTATSALALTLPLLLPLPLLAGPATGASATAAFAPAATAAVPPPLVLRPCRLDGLPQAARCGTLRRPLDPAAPQGVQIDLQVAVLPALARRPADDPVLFIAGGPGQSAIALAGPWAAAYSRLAQRRDLVFIDQRGTGRSAPLRCADDAPEAALRPLAEQADSARQQARLADCRRALQALPHGDLRHFTTAIAVADADAVRAALGAARVNLVGVSYGTRVVLDYARQFPQRLRRAVLDGVVPPDMALASAAAADNQAALDAVFAACAAEPACHQRHPALRLQWQQLLASLPREVSVPHPVSGEPQRMRLDRDAVLGLVRGPLYVPALAAGLPAALAEAAQGRFTALVGLGGALAGGRSGGLATGMHLSVVCSEDAVAAPTAGDAAAAGDFGDSLQRHYRQACADWPRGTLPAGFTRTPPAPAPMWLFSGGADPVTPPRHAQRLMAALGPLARHTVVAHAGHGVTRLPCLHDAVQRFIAADSDAAALSVVAEAGGCADGLPRPPAFTVPGSVAAVAEPSR